MLMVIYRLISLALTAQVKTVPMANWRVYLPGHHEGYISQEEFEDNQVRLARNRTNGEGCVLNGPAREGLTLLQGLLICGCCGRAITVRYQNHGSICPVYLCNWQRRKALRPETVWLFAVTSWMMQSPPRCSVHYSRQNWK